MIRSIAGSLAALAVGFNIAAAEPAAPTSALMKAREGHVTKIVRQEPKEKPAPTPPTGILEKIHYTSPAGKLAAYLSPEPKDGKKHPLVIWLPGIRNGLYGFTWEDNHPYINQLAPAYRTAGLPIMYPSLRGGNDNPGQREGLYGEVDDVLAAVEYASALPWVDSARVYLGGYHAGGTLALLAAEAAPKGRLRAVFSFSPAIDPVIYGEKFMPFDLKDLKERRLRSPVHFLDDISCTTVIIDAEEGFGAVEGFQAKNRNPRINFAKAAGKDHDTILEPTNTLLAERILQDKGAQCSIKITSEEIIAATTQAQADQRKRLLDRDLRMAAFSMDLIFYGVRDLVTPPREAMRKAVEKEMKGIPVLYDYPPKIDPPFIVLSDGADVLKQYPVAEANYFRHSGHGLSDEDIRAIQKTSHAYHARLFNTKDGRWQRTMAFNKAAHAFAVETQTHILDGTTREYFHRDAWKAKRIDGWGEGEIPDIRSQIAIHRYPKGDAGNFRSVTRGMAKFALYDVVIERSVDAEAAAANNLMQAFCQSIAATRVIRDPMHFPVAIDTLPAPIRASYRKDMLAGGSGEVQLAIMKGSYDQGNEDPDNELVEFDFRYGKGNTDDERRAELLKRFWGTKSE